MTTQPIRSKNILRQLETYFESSGEQQFNERNRALFLTCVCTGLRICDVLSLTWNDVYDFNRRSFKASVSVANHKTKKIKTLPCRRR